MKDILRDAMINHLNAELESWYIYLSMAGHFDNESWPGFASWMHTQAEEERIHAMKFYNFLLQTGNMPKLLAIPEPKANWSSPLEIFEEALAHEKKISSLIHKLMDMALEHKDRGTQIFLNWFVEEQLEEEDSVGAIVDRMSRIADSPHGLMMLDSELGKRQGQPAE